VYWSYLNNYNSYFVDHQRPEEPSFHISLHDPRRQLLLFFFFLKIKFREHLVQVLLSLFHFTFHLTWLIPCITLHHNIGTHCTFLWRCLIIVPWWLKFSYLWPVDRRGITRNWEGCGGRGKGVDKKGTWIPYNQFTTYAYMETP
jgi:hypothetical protein